jgi:hypothetical protein
LKARGRMQLAAGRAGYSSHGGCAFVTAGSVGFARNGLNGGRVAADEGPPCQLF